MQYLPVAFAPFQLFFPTGMVIYYITQTVLRIGQQAYITKRFYGGEHTLGRQAQVASQAARDANKKDKDDKSSEFPNVKPSKAIPSKPSSKTPPATAKPTNSRITPPKNQRPAAPSRPQRPATPTKPAPGSRHPKPKK
jgi:YidC/Oxa1 family membrane protein insertase